MTLLISIFAAIIFTVCWYKHLPENKWCLGFPTLMFWGASVMWFVDAIFEYIELGSAYFTVRKTGMSFWTSFVGAVLNIALNLLLIPTWGAMGASIATLASYFLVFVIRTVTMHRFIPFKMYPVRLVINTVLICAIALIMSIWGDSMQGVLASVIILVVSLIINGRDILAGCLDVLRSFKGRRKTTEQ